MGLKEFKKWTQASKQRHIQLIGDYAEEKLLTYTTKEQWTAFIKRNLRPAKQLAPFTDDQIEAAAREMYGADYITKWSLETIAKFLIA